MVAAALAIAALACNREAPEQKAPAPPRRAVESGSVASVPMGRPDPNEVAAREQQRLDEQWRQLQTFREQQAQQAAAAQAAAVQAGTVQAAQALPRIEFVSAAKENKESFKNADAASINAAPVRVPIKGDVRGPSVLKAQVYLDRLDFSAGVIDGRWGRNSAISTWWWQRAHGLPPTGDVDEATFTALAQATGAPPVVVVHALTPDDVAGPFVQIPSDVYEQQKLDCLCYESLREKLAERFHSSEDFLALLNPGVDFSALQAGQSINVPNVRTAVTTDRKDIAKVVISIAGNSFNAYDAAENLIFHAPTTVGSQFDPSPDETVKMVGITFLPNFHYDPTLYHEVPDTAPDAHLKPGPNSPVGVVWIALSKPHYGIHGTKDPESIGYVSSHGCIRLTNWDAEEVAHRIGVGTPVSFVDVTGRGLPAIAKKDR
jgi:lipoprotein-anchoring transpeptidase ErfK/SrfK